MAPVRSLYPEIGFDGGAGHVNLSPNTSHRVRHGRSSGAAKSNSGSPDPDSSSAASELKFVTTTGPPSERSKESRLVVRSHAMQAFLREKKSDGKIITKREPEVTMKSLEESIGRFKLASWSRKSSKKGLSITKDEKSAENKSNNSGAKSSARILNVVARNAFLDQFDPFGILPITLTSQTKNLLYHYTTGFTMNSVAVNPEGSWLSFAITDAALLHATLSLVAYHYDITHSRNESLDCLYQKGEAIRNMNQRLGDGHKQFSDTTIATVALFTNIETMNGTRPVSDVHMTALERMVAVRGGLQNFGHNRVLQRVLAWADIIYASTWNCPPHFTLHDDQTGTLERFSSISDPSLPPYFPYSWCRSNPALSSVLEMLRRLSKAITAPDLEFGDRVAISNNIYFLEHALLSSTPTAIPETHDDFPYDDGFTEADLSEPFRITALLYTHLILRELPSTAKMHHKLVSNLRFVLEEQAIALIQTTSRQTLELLAWIFFVGGAASDLGERLYFVKLLVSVMGVLRLEGKEELKRTLEGVVWQNGICEGYFGDLWVEMTLLQ